MSSLFDDLSVADNEDQIRVADGRKTVSDHQRRSAFYDLGDRGLYLFLGQSVHGRGRLVKDKYRGIGKNGADE